MHLRCPHCHTPVEVLDDSSFKDIVFSSYGSNFSLVGGIDAMQTARRVAKTIGYFELVESVGVSVGHTTGPRGRYQDPAQGKTN